VSTVSRRFRVTGKVQGVYFRHSTRLEAERRGVCGHAKNLADGSVEVWARGAERAVEELYRWLHRGPRDAQVQAVEELLPGEELPPGEVGAASAFEVL
jgi:acylphosphatase